jgi:hypothetical protein
MTPFHAQVDRELMASMRRTERGVQRAIIQSRNEIEDARRLLDDIDFLLRS